MRSTRGRVLIAVLGVVCAALLILLMVSRGGAVTTQTAPTGSAFSVGTGAYAVSTLPFNTPVSISISETGSGSSGTASIVACCDGAAWSWIGLNGNGTVARGNNAVATGTTMCATSYGQSVKLLTTPTAQIQIVSSVGSGPVRVYIHY